ncbi:sulfotransferase [Croceicoccus sp. BE223]|uniref:tetratricopeptide repeat-containing sulfotransferase family protein n=1 Tax=Croceicoccus sp. BE223 TaxID=2817716 RepID=UPI00285D7DE2|nr:sulfotransferase [Croceicoccus sp. BE223]MDR7101635.1 tetratricopeptide (TPR) repeat protein [Croceicoccus sp. BE223]
MASPRPALPGHYHPRLLAAASALNRNDLPRAEPLLRQHLKDDPFDPLAIRMLAELAGRIGRYRDAETLLRRALDIAPDFTAARSNLALVLYRTNRPADAIEELNRVSLEDPDDLGYSNLRAAALGRVGDYDEALEIYRRVLAERPDQPKVWMSYGHLLKTIGRVEDAIAAYRQAIGRRPALGEAWWSLANLKTFRFEEADLAAMEAQLARDDISAEDRFHFDFALGKAREDRGEADAAFAHYSAGNALRRESLPYSAGETRAFVDRSIALATPEFFAQRKGQGYPAPDPIFVVGMPRAGSTLIEQILSSHCAVEGTSELHDIPMLAKDLGPYPGALATMDAGAFRALGEGYLSRTRVHRRTPRPFFIDKLPNNWAHVPLILLALPGAKIINARRHPLGCCFSNFKQHFARGQGFSYALDDMGGYYRDYVRLMAHIDAVQPGRVHRIIYEDMVEDTEGEVRRLLDFCGLPFEPACLSFHETERAVRTASSEQVRQPIYRDGTSAWKPFEAHLGPLVEALGPALTEWRG